jgi:hypothetical protein
VSRRGHRVEVVVEWSGEALVVPVVVGVFILAVRRRAFLLTQAARADAAVEGSTADLAGRLLDQLDGGVLLDLLGYRLLKLLG